MSICAIVAVDENWAIGNKGELLVSLPEDQKQNFKVKTLGHPVVYGRKTLETFPKKMLLPGRENIILSRNKDFAVMEQLSFILWMKFWIIRRNGRRKSFLLLAGRRSMISFCRIAILVLLPR